MVDTLVRDAAAPEAEPAQVEPEPQSHWRIRLEIGGEEIWTGRAVVRFAEGGLISDRVIMRFEERPGRVAPLEVDVEGLRTPDGVELTLHLIDAPFRHGVLNCRARRIDKALFKGRYDMPCANPDSCGCDGGEGPFEMAKVEGAG